MVRENKIAAGPRLENPSRSPARYGLPRPRSQYDVLPANLAACCRGRGNASPAKPTSTQRLSLAGASMLSASSANNHSLFSFGRNGASLASDEVTDPMGSYDFLPSVSFDDLQSSLESASTDFKLTQFPSPTGHGSILEAQGMAGKMGEPSNVTHNGGTTRVAIPAASSARQTRAGPILRRPSTSNRQSSVSSTAASGHQGVPDAPTAPAAMRQRRQSHYPPVSNSNIGKPPRKSVGPGVFEPDYAGRTAQRRRPSMASNSDRPVPGSARSSIDGGSRLGGDTARNLTASRAAKAKSVQPPPRVPVVDTSSADLSSLTPDLGKTPGGMPRSPRPGTKTAAQPLSAKRASAMPGVSHGSHATGLGARTISPTDTRRMKRMSVMNQARDGSQPPATPLLPVEVRASSRSPSMLPRKTTSTPSSSRTTPDPNRKSYSSGLSVGSTTSFNTVRTSTGSIQPRLAPGASSRLPAPKALNLPNPNPDEDEDVPPVPAIPKVYESPKDSPADMSFLEKRKSNLAFDASSIRSIHSNSTGSLSNHAGLDPPPKSHRQIGPRGAGQNATVDLDKKGNVVPSRKNLQPLRLPPITLGPLSTPTAAKIAALQEQIVAAADRNLSPPPTRQTAKTPTTPMTASKSSFFSRNRPEDRPDPPNLRSSSSIHHTHARAESPLAPSKNSSSESIPASQTMPSHSAVSPFLSSSVPKTGLETAFANRSKTGAGYTAPVDVSFDAALPKPSGPRAPAPKAAKPALTSKSPAPGPLSSPEEPATPSSMTSLRRKLSMSWKRSNSKSSIHFLPEKTTEQNSSRQDSMPPPRIPVSTTLGHISTSKPPTPTAASTKPTGGYLESRRRKTSASSLSAIVAHDKGRGDAWGTDRSLQKDTIGESAANRSTVSVNSSVMHKILKPRASAGTVRHHDVWTADLDKDDLVAEEEMKKLGSKRRETELAARTLDALRKRATPKERVSAQDAIRIAMLNRYERGEIVDYNDIYFCGTQNAAKVSGDINSDVPNFGYDDERGDYTIVAGDHLAYRYEIIDILGKGSFGQVVRCIDHKTGVLVAVKIIRNKKRFHQQALVEVNILQKLREWVCGCLRHPP